MDAAKTTEQGNGATPPALARKAKTKLEGIIRLRVEGTEIEIDVRKMTGLEMRTVELMSGRPFAEAGDWAMRGSVPSLLSFLYVAFDRQGMEVGTPDDFLGSWDIDRVDRIEKLGDPTTPADAPAESGAVELDDFVSDSRDSDATGDPSTPASTESIPGTSTA